MPKSKRRKQRVAEASRHLQKAKKKLEKEAKKENNISDDATPNENEVSEEVSNKIKDCTPPLNDKTTVDESLVDTNEGNNGWLGYTLDGFYTGLAKVGIIKFSDSWLRVRIMDYFREAKF